MLVDGYFRNCHFKVTFQLNITIIFLKGTLSVGGISPDLLYNVQLTIYDSKLCVNDLLKNWDSQICCGESICV
jgi:hypothetical protein